jgi:hypothetical protein
MSIVLLKTPNVPDVGTRAKFKTVLSTDPAANTECSITVPADKYYKLVSASVSCAQGATQTPLVALQIADDAGNVVAQFNGASAATSVSTTCRNNWFAGAVLTSGAGLTVNQAPIPADVIIPPNYVISTATAGKGAGTDLGKLSLFVIEYRP